MQCHAGRSTIHPANLLAISRCGRNSSHPAISPGLRPDPPGQRPGLTVVCSNSPGNGRDHSSKAGCTRQASHRIIRRCAREDRLWVAAHVSNGKRSGQTRSPSRRGAWGQRPPKPQLPAKPSACVLDRFAAAGTPCVIHVPLLSSWSLNSRFPAAIVATPPVRGGRALDA